MATANEGERNLPIVGFEDYTITESGEVYSPKGIKLKPQPKNGYASVWLYGPGKRKQVYVHKIMEMMFFKETSEVVNHGDGDKMNPALSNLEPATESQNLKHAYDTGLRLPSNVATHSLKSPEGETVTFTNVSKFCRDNGLIRSRINDVLSGRFKQHRGWSL